MLPRRRKRRKKRRGRESCQCGATRRWSLCLIKYEITPHPETLRLFKKSWATLQTSRQLFPVMCRIYESHGIRRAAVSWRITAVTHASDPSCWWNTRSVQWNVPVHHLQSKDPQQTRSVRPTDSLFMFASVFQALSASSMPHEWRKNLKNLENV